MTSVMIWGILLCIPATFGYSFYESKSIPELFPVEDFVLKGPLLDLDSHDSFIQVQFSMQGKLFRETLPIITGVLHEDYEIEVHNESGYAQIFNQDHQSYGFVPEKAGDKFHILTVLDGTYISGIFEHMGHLYEIRPAQYFKDILNQEEFQRALQQSKMFAFLSEEISNFHPANVSEKRNSLSRNVLWSDNEFPDNSYRWKGCVAKNKNSIFRTKIAFVVDHRVFGNFDRSVNAINSRLIEIFALVNRVFVPQLGLRFLLGKVIVKTAADNTGWNGKRCSENSLEPFTEYVKDVLNRQSGFQNTGAFVLGTSCFEGHNAGRAWISGLCVNHIKAATFRLESSSLWHVLAHEFGHLAGETHSSSGGLMMAYPGKLNNIYQFNPMEDKDMCSHLNMLTGGNVAGVTPQCLLQEPTIFGFKVKPHCRRFRKHKVIWRTEIPATSKVCMYRDSQFSELSYCKDPWPGRLSKFHKIFVKGRPPFTLYIKVFSSAGNIESSAEVSYKVRLCRK